MKIQNDPWYKDQPYQDGVPKVLALDWFQNSCLFLITPLTATRRHSSTFCPSLSCSQSPGEGSLHVGGSSREARLFPANLWQEPGWVIFQEEPCLWCVKSSLIHPEFRIHLNWLVHSFGLQVVQPCWALAFVRQPCLHLPHGGLVWFTAGRCPMPSKWHTTLGWCSLWKPLECTSPLYDRNTTRTFPKGAVCYRFPTRILAQVQCCIATVMRREQRTMELSNSPSPKWGLCSVLILLYHSCQHMGL